MGFPLPGAPRGSGSPPAPRAGTKATEEGETMWASERRSSG